MKKYLIITVLLGLLAACGNAATPTNVPTTPPQASAPTATPSTNAPVDYSDLLITLQRDPCFGFCPVYKLSIRGDGTTTFEGEQHVAITGTQTGTISQADIASLVAEFERTEYFALNDDYMNYEMTDLPYTTTSITYNGKSKTVRHYHGDSTAPEKLTNLENTIDQIANSQQWIGK